MNEPQDDFAALMARVCRDEEEALAALIALYEPAVRGAADILLGRALRSSIDPTDLVQSVHLDMILGLRRKKLAIASARHLRSLAVTLLRHKYIEHWRRHRRQARYSTELALTGGPAGGWPSTSLLAIDPARAAEYNDLVDHLYRHLRAEDRRLIGMRLQGYRTAEIADELGIDPVVVRMRLSRLRRRLRQENLPIDRI
jgi:RNA polymerase sigma-70 factor (ECF subfamily)